MIDYYFYFDRKQKQLMIFKENCFVQTRKILKRARILEAIASIPRTSSTILNWVLAGLLVVGVTFSVRKYKSK